jgi:hypothetical protein
MALSTKPWDGSASRWPDAQSYCKCCLIDRSASGEEPTKDDCSLPVKEPNGDINVNALGPAAAALAGARGGLKHVSAADRKAAAKKLLSYYRQAQRDPPESLKNLAQ